MKCKEICNVLELNIPLETACSWDNVGLLIGRDYVDVKKIYVALDATDSVIVDAISKGAEMIVAHHPMIFSPLKNITSNEFIGNRAINLIRNDISFYAMHTNYDVIRMADVVAVKLGLKNTQPLEYTAIEDNQGLGKIGELPYPMTLSEIAYYIKDTFGLPGVNVFPADQIVEDEKISQIAILPGSGKSAIETVIKAGIKVYITGDIGHHEGVDSASRGLSIIDAGHYGLEHVFVEDMKMVLSHLLPGVEIVGEEIKHPFYCI